MSVAYWCVFNRFWMTLELYAKLNEAPAKQEILYKIETIVGLIFLKVLLEKNIKYH